MGRRKIFPVYAWVVLVFNILVVLWGAFVRATGSGAGCGSHWPLCNGEVIPPSPQVETLIEFSHRLSSGFAFLLVIILFLGSFKFFPRKHPVRLGAVLSLLLIIAEALVGAALVLFEWVAFDASIGRVISIAVHLVITFLLLASLTITAWWASGGKIVQLNKFQEGGWPLAVVLFGVLLIGISGAITALGDTLFPARSLVEGIRQDFSGTEHFLIRLRIWHPVIAVLVAIFTGIIALQLWIKSEDVWVKRFVVLSGSLLVIQLIAGLLNVILLAPVWMQIIHLLLADMVWITLILLTASVFAKIDH